MKKILIIILILLIFFLNVLAENKIIIWQDDNYISIKFFIQGHITNAMDDNIKSGIETHITYNFYLIKKGIGFLSIDQIMSTKNIAYNLKWDNIENKYVVYNKELMIAFSNIKDVEKFIFSNELRKFFRLNQKGIFYVKLNFNFESLKIIPPFSFILFFVNLYNIKIDNIVSNEIKYED